jgi:hypothetical protein
MTTILPTGDADSYDRGESNALACTAMFREFSPAHVQFIAHIIADLRRANPTAITLDVHDEIVKHFAAFLRLASAPSHEPEAFDQHAFEERCRRIAGRTPVRLDSLMRRGVRP